MHPIAYAFLGATWSACMARYLDKPTRLTIGLLGGCVLGAIVLGL